MLIPGLFVAEVAGPGKNPPPMNRVARIPDALLAAALGLVSFVMLYVRYWFPPEKIFDEVYFARAAEEYLQRRYIYESTHPPLTKLLVTLSTILFGGLAHGDTSYGWRFLNVVAGAVAVVLLFLLAKRILRSSTFAVYASLLFMADGMHYVQSRIATPEGFVVCFSLATLYAFCRYWDAVVEHPSANAEPLEWLRHGLEVLGALAAATAFTLVRFASETLTAKIVAAVLIGAGIYAAYRIVRERPVGTPWMLAFAFSAAMLVASKWYGVMAYGVAAVVVGYTSVRAWLAKKNNPFPTGTFVATAIAAVGIVYALVYMPHFIGLRDLQNLPPRAYTWSNIVDMQIECDDRKLGPEEHGIEVLWNPTDDDFLPKPPELFQAGMDFVQAAFKERADAKVFIHCAAGVHRAPMMALAVLCSIKQMSMDDARELIEDKRPVADFADVYVESVRAFLDGRGT